MACACGWRRWLWIHGCSANLARGVSQELGERRAGGGCGKWPWRKREVWAEPGLGSATHCLIEGRLVWSLHSAPAVTAESSHSRPAASPAARTGKRLLPCPCGGHVLLLLLLRRCEGLGPLPGVAAAALPPSLTVDEVRGAL
jgi:hypothetical protein